MLVDLFLAVVVTYLLFFSLVFIFCFARAYDKYVAVVSEEYLVNSRFKFALLIGIFWPIMFWKLLNELLP